MDRESILKKCNRFLTGHYVHRMPVQQVFADLVEKTRPDVVSDVYGGGELIKIFEQEVAKLLGKEAAVFMPSGTMAQQIAMRIWSEKKKIQNIAFHPLCHMETEEEKGYQLLHGLHGILIGSLHRLIELNDVKKIDQPLAAILLELPQRAIGGQLPPWEELKELCKWIKEERKTPLHLDGARLWECKPFYKKEYAEITALFDTVYVSFYKGLGGITGAVLAGPADFISEAKIWQRRHGGNLVRLYPYVLAAKYALEERLPRMEKYHQKAVEIAEALSVFKDLRVNPNFPSTNMMHVFIRRDIKKLNDAALTLSDETGIWMFNVFESGQINTYQKAEWSIGDASCDISTEEITDLFSKLLERAK